jgi:hypothetical protein
LGSSYFLIPKSILEFWLTLLTALQILKLCLLLLYSVLSFESLLIDEFCAMDKFIGEQVSHIYPISSYIEYWLETKQEIEKL